MPARWDNIEILRAIDRIQQERYGGGRIATSNGMYLMDEINGSRVLEDQRWRAFIQELHIARDAGLLSFRVQPNPRTNLADAEPYQYLQTLSDFALTVAGQDRARGRVIAQPLPNPSDDDGRQLSSLILRQIATAITAQYEADEVREFLREEGIPPAQLPNPPEIANAYAILATVWRWGSEGRALTRRFIGRWLANLLPTGPDAELQASLIGQLARQGWRVRKSDAALVIDNPASGDLYMLPAEANTMPTEHASPDAPIFIVHGRDTYRAESVALTVSTATGRKTIILRDEANLGQTLIEKFEKHAAEVSYAIIILTPDDQGGLADENTTQPRGRQNVIFEMGYFFGLIGRRKVSVLICPGVEKPSDMDGIAYITFDDGRAWKAELLRELQHSGIDVKL